MNEACMAKKYLIDGGFYIELVCTYFADGANPFVCVRLFEVREVRKVANPFTIKVCSFMVIGRSRGM